MRRGPLDEELEGWSAIAGGLRPGGMVLCNEPFTSTNERVFGEPPRTSRPAAARQHPPRPDDGGPSRHRARLELLKFGAPERPDDLGRFAR